MSDEIKRQAVPIYVPVIAIDGPSGSGKGTIAHRVASRLGFHVLDSGALYRLLGAAAKRHAVSIENEAALEVLAAHLDVQFTVDAQGEAVILLEGEDVSREIRTEEAGRVASQVAVLPKVRNALLARQQAFREAPGLVADGRDMGTVVFPDADLKIFLTASAEARAERRYKQLLEKGFGASLAALIDDIRARDTRDTERSIAPLKPADGALVLDSTDLGIDAVVQRVFDEAKKAPALAKFLI
ncbi:MAG: (d)CMP kinase [Paraperlucidibaca sp.]|jgi:cytidylate kinase|uniref:(d)CMP kinase n=1 Tax=Paraperlucidibaca sp. TaxID=2708021 RepID=UPI001B3DA230|nr:(d)CMP kinase [Paraperlucidibaca sp.]MBQ0722064.1 (d)CMP kinase [Paraperlucidibaca sp.]MBQ0842145.1 (d)CMP kinase [Paraperlucidibaca sp.]|tara:strand:- start:2222 stop:2947 length:726 start_codon:yes stop_codon:yes gene_type:complete